MQCESPKNADLGIKISQSGLVDEIINHMSIRSDQEDRWNHLIQD